MNFLDFFIPDFTPPFFRYRAILEIDSTTTSPEVTKVNAKGGMGFNLSIDKSNWYYWDGTAWVVANGTVAQRNVNSMR